MPFIAAVRIIGFQACRAFSHNRRASMYLPLSLSLSLSHFGGAQWGGQKKPPPQKPPTLDNIRSGLNTQ